MKTQTTDLLGVGGVKSLRLQALDRADGFPFINLNNLPYFYGQEILR
jgi:hypothetical protein